MAPPPTLRFTGGCQNRLTWVTMPELGTVRSVQFVRASSRFLTFIRAVPNLNQRSPEFARIASRQRKSAAAALMAAAVRLILPTGFDSDALGVGAALARPTDTRVPAAPSRATLLEGIAGRGAERRTNSSNSTAFDVALPRSGIAQQYDPPIETPIPTRPKTLFPEAKPTWAIRDKQSIARQGVTVVMTAVSCGHNPLFDEEPSEGTAGRPAAPHERYRRM